MSMSNESIYDLIPPQVHIKGKGQRYKSIYPPNITPTSSTFNTKTTSQPGLSNVSGSLYQPVVNYSPLGKAGTFGRNQSSINPREFMKKGDGQLSNYAKLPRLQTEKNMVASGRYSQPLLSVAKNSIFIVNDDHKRRLKEPIPARDDKPLMNLNSNQNYIVKNSINNILSSPPVQKESTNYLQKKEYGRIPRYLTLRKDQLQDEYKMVQTFVQEEQLQDDNKLRMVPQDEIKQLKEGLKQKWDQVNQEYQQITHLQKIDTRVKMRLKQGCEKQLQQLEKDMEKLNRQYIFVDNRK